MAKVYLETTVVSYITARPNRALITAANQQISREWWEKRRSAFDLVVSELVHQEAAAGDAGAAAERRALLAGIPVVERPL